MAYLAPGVRLIRKFGPSETFYRVLAFLTTYLTYIAYHIAKRPIAVVESSVNFLNCSTNETVLFRNVGPECESWVNEMNGEKEKSEEIISNMQVFYAAFYAGFMFINGMIAERMDLRYYLTFGLLLTALADFLFGFAHTVGVHNVAYFYVMEAFLGIVNSSGWPGVVTTLSNWLGKSGFGTLFGKGTRGLTMGIWGTHQYLGNIIGLVVAASFADGDWALCFMVPALIIACSSLVVFLFLVPKPSHVGLNISSSAQSLETPAAKEESEKAISLLGAFLIPGVIEFSLCLFSTKLVSYVFLFWLPHYIKEVSGGPDPDALSNLSNCFDWGSMAGGVIAGFLSDQSGGLNALICTTMLLPAVPLLYVLNYVLSGACPLSLTESTNFVGNSCYGTNVFLLIMLGVLISGPFSLITTAVSAELGQHESLQGSSKAIATVTAIIDGCGSIGAAVGPLLAGRLDTDSTIYMLMGFAGIACLCLSRLVYNDVRRVRQRFNS